MLKHCHRFIVIPSRHCVNLAAAVYLVLYDRAAKSMSISEMSSVRKDEK